MPFHIGQISPPIATSGTATIAGYSTNHQREIAWAAPMA